MEVFERILLMFVGLILLTISISFLDDKQIFVVIGMEIMFFVLGMGMIIMGVVKE